jgi:hypothetical protein
MDILGRVAGRDFREGLKKGVSGRIL